jgi:hypothetical protein
MNDNYGVATNADYLHAWAYANDQVNKMKCEDPEIIENICGKDNTCIQWVEDQKERIYPYPSNYYLNTCDKDNDCTMGFCKNGKCTCYKDTDCKNGLECIPNPDSPAELICGYAPQSYSGHCKFTNAKACIDQGDLPYTCTDKTCMNKKDLSKSYTEWHIDPQTKEGKCVLGNFVLRQWCENPQSRCTIDKKTNSYPPGCTSGGDTPGVTDVPPFFYDINTSACYLTHDYCDHYGMHYNKDTCSSSADCPDGNYCYTPQNSVNSYCVGPDSNCYLSSGEKAAQFFLGRTLWYMFKKGTICKENYTHNPELTCSQADPTHMKDKRLLRKNFGGPGIHLYIITWHSGKTIVGFDGSEVEKVYPDMVENHPEGKFICISKEDAKKDKYVKRMYFTIMSKGWMTDLISSTLSSHVEYLKKNNNNK